MAWLPAASLVDAPARSAMARWAGGGIIRSSVATRYQLGFDRHAGGLIAPASASNPHGNWEAARNRPSSGVKSAANESYNLASSSRRKPSRGGRIGGTG